MYVCVCVCLCVYACMFRLRSVRQASFVSVIILKIKLELNIHVYDKLLSRFAGISDIHSPTTSESALVTEISPEVGHEWVKPYCKIKITVLNDTYVQQVPSSPVKHFLSVAHIFLFQISAACTRINESVKNDWRVLLFPLSILCSHS